MIFFDLFSHKYSRVAIILATNIFLANINTYPSLATPQNGNNITEFLKQNQNDARPYWLQRLLGGGGSGAPRRGPSGKNSVCVLPPEGSHRHFMWNERPHFVWFSNLPDLEVKIIATNNDNETKWTWEKKIPNSEENHREAQITSYDGSEELNSEEIYLFEIHAKSGKILEHFHFSIIPDSGRSEIDLALQEIDNMFPTDVSSPEDEDARIHQRLNYLADTIYHKDSSLPETSDEEMLSFDMVNEILNFSSSEDYIKTLRAEYCKDDN